MFCNRELCSPNTCPKHAQDMLHRDFKLGPTLPQKGAKLGPHWSYPIRNWSESGQPRPRVIRAGICQIRAMVCQDWAKLRQMWPTACQNWPTSACSATRGSNGKTVGCLCQHRSRSGPNLAGHRAEIALNFRTNTMAKLWQWPRLVVVRPNLTKLESKLVELGQIWSSTDRPAADV